MQTVNEVRYIYTYAEARDILLKQAGITDGTLRIVDSTIELVSFVAPPVVPPVAPLADTNPQHKICKKCRTSFTDVSRTRNRKKCYDCWPDNTKVPSKVPSKDTGPVHPPAQTDNKICVICGAEFQDNSQGRIRKTCGPLFCVNKAGLPASEYLARSANAK